MRNPAVFIKHPYLIFFIISAVCLLVAMVNSHSSVETKDYRETEGFICNLEETEELWHGRYVTRYEYDIVWYDQGQEYCKHLEGQIDYKEEGPGTIWVHPENTDAILGNPEDVSKDSPAYMLISIVTAIIGYILFKVQYNERRMSRSELEDYLFSVRIGSMLAVIFSVIGGIMVAVVNYNDEKNGEYVRLAMYDPIVLCGVIAVIGLFQFFKAGRKMKKMGF